MKKQQVLVIGLLSAVSLIMGPFFSSQAHALSGSDFKPGRIIDDAIFTNKDAMNPTQIQNFLNSKVPVCNTNRGPYTGSSGTTYYPPFTCLKEYVENPVNGDNNYGRPTYSVPGGKSAAQIIWEAGQAYGINPQTLIVTLQKEQGLVTDDWPIMPQFTKAMGYLCPDTAPCSASAGGFYKQVSGAAWQFRHDLDGIGTPGFWSLYARGQNNILYNPAGAGACGTRSVYIETQATAVLYKYTPYTPNDATLALVNDNTAGGTAPCGAYGNRNFWWYFSKWFGSTLAADYDYSFVSSTSAVNRLDYNQRLSSTIVLKNTGVVAWYSDDNTPIGKRPTRLSIANYQNSAFASPDDPNWLGTKNQVKMTPAVVNPGENATFTFEMIGPNRPSSEYINFVPVVDGIGFMRNINMRFSIASEQPRYAYVTATNPPDQLLPGQQSTSSVVIKNMGNGAWYADDAIGGGKRPLRLASKQYENVPFASPDDPNWLGTKNQVKMTPAVVNPGENATFTFSLIGTNSAKNYAFRFMPVLDGITFLNDSGMLFYLNTPAPSYVYQFDSVVMPPSNMTPGQIAQVTLRLKNIGNTVWKNEQTRTTNQTAIRLVMAKPWYRNSQFYDNADTAWLTPAQVALRTAEVKPGEIGEFVFNWKAPATPGVYTEYFAPVADGVTLMNDINMGFRTTVQ